MGLFDDILKGLPVNPLLREKIAELEAKYAATETENAILKDDLRNAEAENQKLKKQVEEFTHTEIDETELNLLILIAKLSDHIDTYEAYVLPESGLSSQRLRYHTRNLREAGYISDSISQAGLGALYLLTHKARQLLISRGEL